MALLKVDAENLTKLEMKEYVKSSEDIQIRMKYKDQDEGEMEIKAMIENPIKVMFMINSVIPVPKPNCSGPETSLTAAKQLEGCDDEGTASTSPSCDTAFSDTEYWQATDSPSIISIIFKVEIFPKKLIFKPDPDKGKMPSKITVN